MKRTRTRKRYNQFKSNLGRLKRKNPLEWWKWLLFGGLVLLVVKVISKIGSKIDGIGNNHAQYSDNPDGGWFDPSVNTSGNTNGQLAGDTSYLNVPSSIEELIDSIYVHLNGYNSFAYPEIVNRIANLSDSDVAICVSYWNEKYSSNGTLYQFISSEFTGNNWLDGYQYEPALSKLESLGYL